MPERLIRFFAENWIILLEGLPVSLILLFLICKFFKLLRKDAKGTLGALLAVLGVLAFLIVPALIFDPEKWAVILQIAFVVLILIAAFVTNPKGMAKVVLITLGACAIVIAIGFIFGIGIAMAAAANGVMSIFPVLCFRNMKKLIDLERNGLTAQGTVLGWTDGKNAMPIVEFHTEEGRLITKRMDGGEFLLTRKSGKQVSVIYDENDPDGACLKKRAMIGSILAFCLFAALEAGTLAISIFLLIMT